MIGDKLLYNFNILWKYKLKTKQYIIIMEEFDFNTTIPFNSLIKNEQNDNILINSPYIMINLKDYDFHYKHLNKFFIKLKSENINLDKINNIKYAVISDSTILWSDNFKNKQNIILKNIIFPIDYIIYNSVFVILYNIDSLINLLNYFDDIEIQIYGNFYKEKLPRNSIQLMDYGETFNLLTMYGGMCGNKYSLKVSKKSSRYDEIKNLTSDELNDFFYKKET